ncbi:MAG: DNA polymerase III subunit delta [Verrucomicrobiota bacterium]
MAAKAKPSVRKSGNFSAVIGSDEGLMREKALELYNQLTGGVDDGFTHETIDGIADNSDSAFEICSRTVQALQTLPMFGGDKVVWLRNANFLADNVTGRSQRTEAGVEMLREALEGGVPDGVKFLMTAPGVDKRRSFWKFIEQAADVLVFDKIDTSRDDWQDQVAALVTRRAAEMNLTFDSDALALFVMLAGEQSQQIGNELEKLDLYLGDERRFVTEDDVRLLVPLSRAAVVFEIGKALQTGNVTRAIRLIDEQLEADESPIGIMRASIIGVVRNLFMAKLVMEQFRIPAGNYQGFAGALNRLPEADRAWLPQKKDGSGVNVFPIFLALPNARNFDLDGLRHVLEATMEADKALVTTGLDPRLILHRLVVEIAAARKDPGRKRAG